MTYKGPTYYPNLEPEASAPNGFDEHYEFTLAANDSPYWSFCVTDTETKSTTFPYATTSVGSLVMYEYSDSTCSSVSSTH